MPAHLNQHIAQVRSPKGDGHCGYRCAAWVLALEEPDGLYAGEDGWYQVRKDLIKEVTHQRKELYEQIFGQDLDQVVESLKCEPGRGCPKSKWMNQFNVGWPLANTYNRPVIFLDHASFSRNLTFLPQHMGPQEGDGVEPMVLAFVNSNHWVWVKLKGLDGKPAPYPPVAGGWERFKTKEATPWKDLVKKNLEEWEGLETPRENKGKGVVLELDKSDSEAEGLQEKEAVEPKGNTMGKRSSRNKSVIFTSYKNL